MKKVLLTLLAVVLVIGVLAAAGFAGYRVGYNQGARSASNGEAPLLGRSDRFGPDRMPMHNFGRDFDRGFNRGFQPGEFRMMHRGGGFGFFFPFMFLGHLVIWGLIFWLIYLLFTRSGLRLSLTQQKVQNTPPNVETEPKPQEQEQRNE